MTDSRAEQQIEALAELVKEWRKADHDAAGAYQKELDRRLSDMNHLREQIGMERGIYVTNTAYTARHDALNERVTLQENRLSRFEGRLAGYSSAAAFIGIFASIAIKFVH